MTREHVIFDNRCSLFPQLNIDEKIETVLGNQGEILKESILKRLMN